MQTFKIFVRTLKVMKKQLFIYLTAIIMMTVMSSLFEVANSAFTKQVIDCSQEKNINVTVIKLLVTALLGIFAAILASVFMLIYNNKAKWAALELKKQVVSKALKLPMQYYDEHHSGEMLAMSVYDTDIASEIYSSRLRRVLAPIVSVLVFTISMFIINPIMAVIMLTLNILLFLINTFIANPVKTAGRRLSYSNARMTERLSNMIAGIEISKMYDNCNMGLKRYQSAGKQYVAAQKEKMKWIALSEAINKGFELLCALMFVVVGVILVQKKLATVGEISGIYTMYATLSFRFLQLGKNYPELMNCIVYAEKIFKFLEYKEEDISEELNNDSVAKNTENAIEVKNVAFIYKNGSGIKDKKSYEFPNNKLIALTGKSGCGKSTLVKLILGYYPLQNGQIYVLGRNIDNWGYHNVRNNIAYIPQEPYLFEVSIMENIRYGRYNASDEEVVNAAKLANAHDFIMKCCNGYDTIIGKHGNNLSGGERQRIAIARAILKDTPVIIMDEATSALDNESERLVQEAIGNISSNKTVIMIAHRQTTINRAEIVVRM